MTTDPLVERRARGMNTRERAEYLHEAGWRRISYHGAQSWRSPDPSDRAAWTLAAAIRAALATENQICPACREPAYYVRQLDRFIHTDGSPNDACWLAILRGPLAGPIPNPRKDNA